MEIAMIINATSRYSRDVPLSCAKHKTFEHSAHALYTFDAQYIVDKYFLNVRSVAQAVSLL